MRYLVLSAITTVSLVGCTGRAIDELGSCETTLDCKHGQACVDHVCVEVEGGEDSGPDTQGDAGSGPEETTRGDASTGYSTGGHDTTSDDGTTSIDDTTWGATTGPSCECESDVDCAGGQVCIGCVCLGDAQCVVPTCDACGDCAMCLACAQGEGGECYAENQACNANPECVALVNCGSACADSACLEQCIADHPDGAEDFFDLRDCLFPARGTVCRQSCG